MGDVMGVSMRQVWFILGWKWTTSTMLGQLHTISSPSTVTGKCSVFNYRSHRGLQQIHPNTSLRIRLGLIASCGDRPQCYYAQLYRQV